jgi:hypothetical protein
MPHLANDHFKKLAYQRSACQPLKILFSIFSFPLYAYVSIRQNTSAYVSIESQAIKILFSIFSFPLYAYVSIRQRMSAYVSIESRAPQDSLQHLLLPPVRGA